MADIFLFSKFFYGWVGTDIALYFRNKRLDIIKEDKNKMKNVK